MSANPQSIYDTAQPLTHWSLREKLERSLVAKTFNLSATSILVLNQIITHWNAQRQDSYPSQETISLHTNKSVRSVQRGLLELTQKGLITIQQTKLGNKYFLTTLFFEALKNNSIQINKTDLQKGRQIQQNQNQKCHMGLPKMTPPCINIKKEQDNIITSLTYDRSNQVVPQNNIEPKPNILNDDVSLKSTPENDLQLKKSLNKLKSWGVWDSNQLITKYTLTGVDIAVKYVENSNPKNPGAYLREVLKSGYDCTQKIKKDDSGSKLKQLEEALRGSQYIKHLPSGKILKAFDDPLKRDYIKNGQRLNFWRYDIEDLMINFAPATQEEYEKFGFKQNTDFMSMNRDQAQDFCRNLPLELRTKSSLFKRLMDKWSFSKDEIH